MNRFICFFLLAVPLLLSAQLQYPESHKVDTVDDYNGIKVADPFRWLEDENSEETKQWVQQQNKVTSSYLAGIPFRGNVKNRLEELWNYPRFGTPVKKGVYYYFFKNNGLQNQSVVYRQKGIYGTPEVFFDPNKLSTDGTVALSNWSYSKSAKYIAYTIAMSGSDWQVAYVLDIKTRKQLPDSINWIKFSELSWKGDEGFYYSRYPEPEEKSKLIKQNQFHQVWYHKLGALQSDDVLIFEDKEHPLRNVNASVTEDNRFLIIEMSEGTDGNEIWVKNLRNSNEKKFSLLIPGFKTNPVIISNVGDELLVRTNEDAPNYKVVMIDPKNPSKENWITIIPEKEESLQGVGKAGGYLFATYLKDAATKVSQYSYDGKFIRDIKLPGIGSAGGFNGEFKDREFFYSFSSFNYPPTIFRYDILSGKSSLFSKTEVKFDVKQFETKQVFFTSHDGTKIPMFLTYRKGIKQDGSNPVLIYGYGGFNIPLTPGFSISNAFFMEQGGIYALVNLRGGSEYGEKWHTSGMLEKKQNVFDDFIGAAEYLIKENYTNSQKIAIRGGSNGGLLVGAAITQRPDLFKVAIPQVGVMDMLRYHKFTIGWAWAVEYGRSDNPKDFPFLYKYSPLHNFKKGTHYPATLITTADHDDRVVPAHSFKFAAAMQEAQSGENPVLIRIETKAGHGAGKPTSKQIEEAADIWSFVMYNLGMTFKDPKLYSPNNKLKAF
jgi:prolyl oligopeptidase